MLIFDEASDIVDWVWEVADGALSFELTPAAPKLVKKKPRKGKAGSPAYERWQNELLRFRQGIAPKHGAIWLTYYPHIMLECYPHVLTVSTLHPITPQKTLNVVEFYYPEEIAAFETEFMQAQQAAYMETCVEDDEIALRMDAGRLALMQRGDDESGPYQSPMEDGMQHFHEWYRRAVHSEQDPICATPR